MMKKRAFWIFLAAALVGAGCERPQVSDDAGTDGGGVDGGGQTDPVCGDGVIDTGESCDGTALGGRTCADEGFESGTLRCASDCTFDTSTCEEEPGPMCGDGAVNGTEECDGTELGGATCESEGFDGGTIACSGTCELDTSACFSCGDGIVNGTEECDGTDLGGATCESRGFTGGTLACDASCTFDETACTSTPAPASVWINEIHYDNDGADTGEGVEIAGTAGFDLTDYEVVLYNGSNDQTYGTIALTGTIPDEGSGFGALWFGVPRDGLQNGPSEGIALVDPSGVVLQFLCYEGTITAANGPASGMTCVDIGVSQPGSTPVGETLQLTGTGSSYSDFTWTGPVAGSPGMINAGQTFP